jgi:helicase MOV-10
VSVTRAKALLIVIGDPVILSLDPLWRAFLNYIHNNGGWKGPPITWDPNAPINEKGGYDESLRQLGLDDMNNFTRRMESLTIAGAAGEGNESDDDWNVDRPWREVE